MIKLKQLAQKVKNKVFGRQGSIKSSDSNFMDWWNGGEVDAMQEITYFTCIRVLSEAIGKIPFETYLRTENGDQRQSGIIQDLLERPNAYTEGSTFWQSVEANRLHYGNAYVYVRYDEQNNPLDLWLLPSSSVQIMIDNTGIFGQTNAIYYQWFDPNSGQQHLFHADNVLHFKANSLDGITGNSTRSKLSAIIRGAHFSQEFLNQLNENGLSARAVLQFTSDLDEVAKKRLLNGLNKFASGAENAGRIIPVPLGMTLTPLNLKLTDAQFTELKKYSALQIAAAFGIKPNHLNDYGNSNYSNSEMQQLSFYTDTLLYTLKHYEEILKHGLYDNNQRAEGNFIRLDSTVVLRADSETMAKTLSSYVQGGIITPNEAREKINLPKRDHGDVLMANGTFIPVEMVGQQYKRGGNNNEEQ